MTVGFADCGTALWVTLPDDYFTPRSIRAANVWNLATRYGQLDVTFAPSAFPTGYAELRKRADHRQVAGTSATVLVAPLEDVHRSKRAADRPKDQDRQPAPQPKFAWPLVAILRHALPSEACVGLR